MKETVIAIRLFVTLTILTGVTYPLTLTLITQAAFHDQANGSLITRQGKLVGSRLIGQHFDDPKYLWGRPSATLPMPYNASASSGSNFGPTNPDLIKAIHERVQLLQNASADKTEPVPTELVTASGSGLDPHISVSAAEYQVKRIAVARSIPESKVRQLIEQLTEPPTFGLIGEYKVNVLEFNLALDAVKL